MPDRVPMLAADGKPLGWTYDAVQYALVRGAIFDGLEALGDADGTAALIDLVAFAQDRLVRHQRFPSGRLTNATRHVAADLRGRGELVRVGGGSPQRLRRPAAS